MALGNFGGGTGTMTNPYRIEDSWDLDAVRNNLSAHYVLVADIDLSTHISNGGWIPIGSYKWIDGKWYNEPFTGSLDGNYFDPNLPEPVQYKISNLTIIDSTRPAGLIGHIANPSTDRIRNLILTNIDIIALKGGGLAHSAESPTSFLNCRVQGKLEFKMTESFSSCGGVVGEITTGVYLKNVSFDGDLSAEISNNFLNIGGLVGSNGGQIDNCSVKGVVRAKPSLSYYGEIGYTNIGGIVGSSNGNIVQSYNLSDIISVTDIANAGGIVGECYGLSYRGITSVYNSGKIDTPKAIRAGGLIGLLRGATIRNCYSIGDVNASNILGGFVGLAYNTKLENCHAVWYNTNFTLPDYTKEGGFAGSTPTIIDVSGKPTQVTKAEIISCYYDFTKARYTDDTKGLPKTTTEMKQQTTFEGWIFSTGDWGWTLENPKYEHPVFNNMVDKTTEEGIILSYVEDLKVSTTKGIKVVIVTDVDVTNSGMCVTTSKGIKYMLLSQFSEGFEEDMRIQTSQGVKKVVILNVGVNDTPVTIDGIKYILKREI